ncbi:MAG TPA: glycosyltransferase family 2 protein [Pyrinomonadaceae bacterium]|nr:glycosyltransferase family 2 protein [Pyrinomonadaceae bacterium]
MLVTRHSLLVTLNSGPHLSVIVPVYNGGAGVALCLDALAASVCDEAFEIIVVDDCSTDGSGEAARARGAEVLRLAERSGPSAARNRGAERARGDVLFFVDADVVVRRDTLARVVEFMRAHTEVAAVFGSYDDAPADRHAVSLYKNLLHHYVHQHSNEEAETFWAGCGAIRRAAFEEAGGFDERRYARPSIEDIELGRRLRRRGARIRLDKGLQVKHLKRWTLPTLVRTDIFARAVPWSRLIFEGGAGVPDDLNLRTRDRASALLAGAGVGLVAASALAFAWTRAFVVAAVMLACALVALAAVLYLNRRLFGFFFRLHGATFAARAYLLHLLYFLYSGAAFAYCFCEHALGRRARREKLAAEQRRVRDA